MCVANYDKVGRMWRRSRISAEVERKTSWAQCNKYFWVTHRPGARCVQQGDAKGTMIPALRNVQLHWGTQMYTRGQVQQDAKQARGSKGHPGPSPIQLILMNDHLSLPHSLFSRLVGQQFSLSVFIIIQTGRIWKSLWLIYTQVLGSTFSLLVCIVWNVECGPSKLILLNIE